MSGDFDKLSIEEISEWNHEWKYPLWIGALIISLMVGLYFVIQLTRLVGGTTSWFFGLLTFVVSLSALVAGVFRVLIWNDHRKIKARLLDKEAKRKAELNRFSVNKAGVARDNNPRKAGL